MKKVWCLLLTLCLILPIMLSSCTTESKKNKVETTSKPGAENAVPLEVATERKVYSSNSALCLSFNILGNDDQDSLAKGIPDAKTRYREVISYIRDANPDLICIQEARYMALGSQPNWHDALANVLAADGYGMISRKTEENVGPTLSTGLIIFYRLSRYEKKESGYQSFNIKCSGGERAFVWGELWDKNRNTTVFVTNTHWCYPRCEGGEAHQKAEAEELLKFWQEVVGDNVLFACGDYNSHIEDSCINATLSSGIYKDGLELFSVGSRDGNTNFDHCFVNPGKMKIISYLYYRDLFTFNNAGCLYSDHRELFIMAEY